jgi:hypothetical protein
MAVMMQITHRTDSALVIVVSGDAGSLLGFARFAVADAYPALTERAIGVG